MFQTNSDDNIDWQSCAFCVFILPMGLESRLILKTTVADYYNIWIEIRLELRYQVKINQLIVHSFHWSVEKWVAKYAATLDYTKVIDKRSTLVTSLHRKVILFIKWWNFVRVLFFLLLLVQFSASIFFINYQKNGWILYQKECSMLNKMIFSTANGIKTKKKSFSFSFSSHHFVR